MVARNRTSCSTSAVYYLPRTNLRAAVAASIEMRMGVLNPVGSSEISTVTFNFTDEYYKSLFFP